MNQFEKQNVLYIVVHIFKMGAPVMLDNSFAYAAKPGLSPFSVSLQSSPHLLEQNR